METQQIIDLLSEYENQRDELKEYQNETLFAFKFGLEDPDFEERSDIAWDEQHNWQHRLEDRAFELCKELKQVFKSRNDIRSMLEVHMIEMDLKYCKQNQFFWQPKFDVIFEKLGGLRA